MPRKPSIPYDLIIELGKTMAPLDIARQLGLQRTTVWAILKRAGVPLVRSVVVETRQAAREQILKLGASRTLTYKAIGKLCNCSQRTVKDTLGKGSPFPRGRPRDSEDAADNRPRLSSDENVSFLTALCRNETPPASLTIKPTAPVFFPRAEHHSSTGTVWE